jgi:large subunit ribosomal protein L35
MPKMKTNKSVAKRIKVTGSGKLMRRKAGMGHLLSGKRPKRKRRLKRGTRVKATETRRVRSLLGC